jgi:hypothetical protein
MLLPMVPLIGNSPNAILGNKFEDVLRMLECKDDSGGRLLFYLMWWGRRWERPKSHTKSYQHQRKLGSPHAVIQQYHGPLKLTSCKGHHHSQSHCCICGAENAESCLFLCLFHGALEGVDRLHQYKNPTLNPWSEICFVNLLGCPFGRKPNTWNHNWLAPIMEKKYLVTAVMSTKEKRNVGYKLEMS